MEDILLESKLSEMTGTEGVGKDSRQHSADKLKRLLRPSKSRDFVGALCV